MNFLLKKEEKNELVIYQLMIINGRQWTGGKFDVTSEIEGKI